MEFSQFNEKVHKILNVELPPGELVINEGRLIAKTLCIGITAFMDKMGVKSEAEYKGQCAREKRIMYHAHVGMSSWKATAEALRFIYKTAEEANLVIDRAGICLDRRMGLPRNQRNDVPAETGPMLDSSEDWMQVGQVVPIQPHMGDFMIGFPASTENTINALRAGVTTIGNLSQFFSHEVPMWHDHVTTTVETVRALSIMGALREKGTLIHSYLEDGFGALFYDCATVAGWAYLEHYLVEQLIGGKLSHCVGGLTTDPVKRAGWVFILDEIHNHEHVGSMIYGDTISLTKDFVLNRAIIAEYLLWDIMAQLRCPTGHAVLPLPVTEAIRVPSAEEIAEAQSFGRRMEGVARRLLPHFDFGASYDFCEKVISSGKQVFTDSLEGLKEAGVNVRDPLEMLYVLKKLGPHVFEEMFGRGRVDRTYANGRSPIVPTDVFAMSLDCIEKYRPLFLQPKITSKLKGRRMLIASTDVHEHAIIVINQLLSEAGAEMINIGAEKNPDEVASKACTNKVEAILISTHNGMALDYANNLKEELRKRNAAIPVLMGGILNQKFEDTILPVNVAQKVKELGFHVSAKLDGGFRKMLEFYTDHQEVIE